MNSLQYIAHAKMLIEKKDSQQQIQINEPKGECKGIITGLTSKKEVYCDTYKPDQKLKFIDKEEEYQPLERALKQLHNVNIDDII